MKLCPSCHGTYPDDDERCEKDGQWLIDPGNSRDPADGYLGQVLQGRYQILSKLGAGSVGAVFRADDLQAGGNVAVKVLMPTAGYNEPRAARRLKREARAASGLDHPNIVRVLDYGEADGVPYLVMELVEGEELGDVLKREGQVDLHRAVHIVDQIASSLTHAHGRGIVHRDLKPENIFLTRRDGRPNFVKVLDFGLVKLIVPEGGIEPTRITEQNLVLGTPHYMAPEQITGGRIAPTTDLYSLGVLLYRMTVGQVPFPSDNVIVVMQMHVKEQPTPPSQMIAGYPAALEQLIMDLLAKDPRSRPQTADDIRQRIATDEFQSGLTQWAQWASKPGTGGRSAPALAVTGPSPAVAPRRSEPEAVSDPKLPPAYAGPNAPAYAGPDAQTPPMMWWMVGGAWMVALITLLSVFVILRS